jgi:FdhE protein
VSDTPGLVGGGGLGEIPYLRPHPGPALFARRVARFNALAEGHTLGDYLQFCGRLSAAQAVVSGELPVAPDDLGLPSGRPLDAATLHPGEWTDALRLIVRELSSAPMPAAAREGLTRLAGLGREELAALGAKILSGKSAGLDLAVAPFAAAALQVQFVARAARISAETVARAEGGCPLCGSPPVAGVVLGDDKLRYLACALCGSQWYLTRVKCSRCGSTAGISYFSLEGDPTAVKAEVCDACKSYLKLFYLEQRPATEPVADDLATLALDMLVSEQGYGKNGVNLFLHV